MTKEDGGPSDEIMAWVQRTYPYAPEKEKYKIAGYITEYRSHVAAGGGKARAKALTAKERSENAKLAAQARWSKKGGKK